MADPISRLNLNDSANACIDGDGETNASGAAPGGAPAAPRSTTPRPSQVREAEPSTPFPSSVIGLVARFLPGFEVHQDVTTEGPVPGTSSYRISTTALSEQVTR